jgi:ABC-type multidrug transport system fused ATPase/permease subunit
VPHRHVLSVNFTKISSAHNNDSSRENEAFASNYDNWVNFVYFYSIILGALLYFSVHRSFLFFKLCLRASVRIHERLFCGITRATLRFFECNSLRQILSHFTSDIEKLDNQVPITIYDSITVRSRFACSRYHAINRSCHSARSSCSRQLAFSCSSQWLIIGFCCRHSYWRWQCLHCAHATSVSHEVSGVSSR